MKENRFKFEPKQPFGLHDCHINVISVSDEMRFDLEVLMKHYFICSLCHNGILGGGLIVDEQVINYKTGKVTVESKYRNLVLNRDDINSLSWKWVIFPKATFEMKNGEKYIFFIFNKWRFMKIYDR